MNSNQNLLKIQVGLFGRTNVGKTKFLSMIADNDFFELKPHTANDTEVIERKVDLSPIGPIIFLDNVGVSDNSLITELISENSLKIFERSDVIVLLIESNVWTDYEEGVVKEVKARRIPFLVVVNKIDETLPTEKFLSKLRAKHCNFFLCSSVDCADRDMYVAMLKKNLVELIPQEFFNAIPLVSDFLRPGSLAVLVVSSDMLAPKGRLIIPQVQTIRDCLDNNSVVSIVKDSEYTILLNNLKTNPDIVICESQLALNILPKTPEDVLYTTFAMLSSRYSGGLVDMVRNVLAVEKLQEGDKVLIAEACNHHAIQDDIGKVKIPRWLKQYKGAEILFDFSSGREYADNLSDYKLIIHCDACMLNRKEMLLRLQTAREAEVPVTNYGIVIAYLEGILERVLSPFPEALIQFQNGKAQLKNEMDMRTPYEIIR
ncbi:MAG: [FeFe] hydrogenase H-cluster maturation GTPase HydF [bacterium]